MSKSLLPQSYPIKFTTQMDVKALKESQGGATIAQVIIRRAEGAILDTMHTITLAEMVAPHCLGKRAVDP